MKPRYIQITLLSLKDCFKNIPFDLYLQLAEDKFVKAFEKTTGLDFARLANYEAKGVKYFFVDEREAEALEHFLAQSPLMTLIHSDCAPEVRRQAFFAVMEQSLFESFGLSSVTQMNVAKTFEALKSSLEKDTDFLKAITLLGQIAPKTDFFFRHAITTCVYAYVVGQLAGQASHRSMKIILFAALFHDLGKTKLPENRRFAYQNRSIDEIREFRMHPQATVNMFETALPFADEEIRTCILQHRERQDGKGYPYEIKGVSIYALARILSIADGFSELTLGLEDGNIYTPIQAIATMKGDTGHYDQKLLVPFAQLILSRDFAKAA